VKSLRSLSSKAVIFLERQGWDWKITVLRTSLDRFAYQTVFPYLSLYIVALGAIATGIKGVRCRNPVPKPKEK
jgi:hypothetical protein